MPPPPRAIAAHGVGYRAMGDADLAFVAALYASTRREEVAATGWPAAVQDAFLAQQHEAQHRHYMLNFPEAERLIVEREGEAIGRLYLRDEPGALHILDIALLPHARGTGIGGAILRDILDLARTQGRAVTIYVEKTNRARHLYDRLGFVAVEDAGVYDRMRAEP